MVCSDTDIRRATSLVFGLKIGLRDLRRACARTRIGILQSDAVHNAGPDPRDVVLGYERLHVLLETDGEHDEQLHAILRDAATAR